MRGLFEIHVFQKEFVFQVGEIYISTTIGLSVEAPILATVSFFQSEHAPALLWLMFLEGW